LLLWRVKPPGLPSYLDIEVAGKKKIEKMYSFEYTEIPNVFFMPSPE